MSLNKYSWPRSEWKLVGVVRSFVTRDEGSNLVEFALSALIFCAVLFGIFYFSLALYTAHFVTNAADDAARYAVVRGSSWNGTSCQSVSSYDCTATSTNVSNYVLSTIPPAISPANLTIATTWPGTTSSGGTCDTFNGANSPNCQVEVQVGYAFALPIPLGGARSLNLSSTSSMTIAR
jgi:Flp pilus assembly protein TadG